MRGVDWLFLALAGVSAGAAGTCAYYARNCSANTDLAIRSLFWVAEKAGKKGDQENV